MGENDDRGDFSLARRNRYLTSLRRQVPEFEPTFAALIADDSEAGPFEATSEYARWVSRVDDPEVLRRAFAAVDDAEAQSERDRWNEASGLSGEFCSALHDAAGSLEPYERFMGPWVLEHSRGAQDDWRNPLARRLRALFRR